MSTIVKKIDEVISNIKSKGDIGGFTYGDTKIILTFEIARLEISNTGSISNLTVKAISEIEAMTSYENYKYKYPEVYNLIQKTTTQLYDYNPNFLSADSGIIGFAHEKWCNYFGGSIRYLLDKINPSTKQKKK